MNKFSIVNMMARLVICPQQCNHGHLLPFIGFVEDALQLISRCSLIFTSYRHLQLIPIICVITSLIYVNYKSCNQKIGEIFPIKRFFKKIGRATKSCKHSRLAYEGFLQTLSTCLQRLPLQSLKDSAIIMHDSRRSFAFLTMPIGFPILSFPYQ